jgi:low affinity Fe/Cu permease
MNELFRKFSHKTSELVGSPWAFIVAAAVIIVWAVTGPLFGFSDTWQLVINTGTTIVTFLMVFLIQNTQNRDAKAIHLKLDELLRATDSARTSMVDLENLSDEELERIHAQFQSLRKDLPLVEDDMSTISQELQQRRTRRTEPEKHGKGSDHNGHGGRRS